MTRWKAQLILLGIGICVLSIFLYQSWDALDADWKPQDHRNARVQDRSVAESFRFREEGGEPVVIATRHDATGISYPLLWIRRNRALYIMNQGDQPGLGFQRFLISRQRLQDLAAEVMALEPSQGPITLKLSGHETEMQKHCTADQFAALTKDVLLNLAASQVNLEGVTIRAKRVSDRDADDGVMNWPTQRISLADCANESASSFTNRELALRLEEKAIKDGYFKSDGKVYRVWIRPLLAK